MLPGGVPWLALAQRDEAAEPIPRRCGALGRMLALVLAERILRGEGKWGSRAAVRLRGCGGDDKLGGHLIGALGGAGGRGCAKKA
jgi:hypothetical protein